MKFTSPLTPVFLRTVSSEPGVYLMVGKDQVVLYVGKARDLCQRLSSYRRHLGERSTKTGVMLAKVVKIETIITGTEKEALILEASLIKRLKPKYNIILRDDKNYPLIKVTVDEEWPRVVVTRNRQKKDKAVYGPFSSISAMWETIRYLNKLFPLRRCKGKGLKERARPCLNYQMKRCLAPCAGKISAVEYQQVVKNVLMVLSGRDRELVKKLKKEMREAAGDLEFERAAHLRDKISALSRTMEKQVVAAAHHKNQDVFGLAREGSAVAISVLRIRDGLIGGHHSYFLDDTFEDDQLVLGEVLERFYSDDAMIPAEILLPIMPPGIQLLTEWLSDAALCQVKIKIPQRGDLANLLGMAEKNARQVFADLDKKRRSWQGMAVQLKKCLGLTSEPERITCMDISNLGSAQMVGSVVSFWQGAMEKDKYRNYKIRSIDGPDDYGAMAELLERHIMRAAEQDFLPDLLLVDGGKGQLNVAIKIVAELGLTDCMDLAGIAKEKKEEGEKLYRPGRKNQILLPGHSQVLLLLMKVRDEAHRYGITLHRKWRLRESFNSPLDKISGVGPARKRALLKKLGSLKRIAAANLEELSSVEGIGQELAQIIHNFFNKRGESHERNRTQRRDSSTR